MGLRRARRVSSLLVFLALLGACSASESGDDLISGEALYSQGNEELIIRHFFGDREGGFFVDVGCYDWKELSTTLYLEKHLGWSGIGIDANAQHARGYAENRPNTQFMNYIVTDHSDTEATLFLAVGAEGVSSTSEAFIRSFFDIFFGGAEPELREVTVPTITLNDTLDRNGITRIDFLSMDIEGHEPTALAGFDIERFRPELVCIESARNAHEFGAYFGAHGYELIVDYLEYDIANLYFRPKPLSVAR